MKEIGEKLKEAREEIGISLEEASTDLKIDEKQLENLENGETDKFKDIVNVKYLIRDYAKYLGLDKEDLVDEFNEYLFDFTSKITLEDIKTAKEIKKNKDNPKVKSPYTTVKQKKELNIPLILMLVLIVVIGIAILGIMTHDGGNTIYIFKKVFL